MTKQGLDKGQCLWQGSRGHFLTHCFLFLFVHKVILLLVFLPSLLHSLILTNTPLGFSLTLNFFQKASNVDTYIPGDCLVFAIAYDNDLNPLAYGDSTDETRKTLATICRCFLRWSNMLGAKLALEDGTYVHLVKQKYVQTITLHLRTFTLYPRTSASVLGRMIYSKLFLHPYIAVIKEKIYILVFALTKLKLSTGGASLPILSFQYFFIVCIILTKAHTAEH